MPCFYLIKSLTRLHKLHRFTVRLGKHKGYVFWMINRVLIFLFQIAHFCSTCYVAMLACSPLCCHVLFFQPYCHVHLLSAMLPCSSILRYVAMFSYSPLCCHVLMLTLCCMCISTFSLNMEMKHMPLQSIPKSLGTFYFLVRSGL